MISFSTILQYLKNVEQFIHKNQFYVIFYTFLIIIFTIPLISIRQFRKQYKLRHQHFKNYDVVSAEYSTIGMRQTNEDAILIQNNVKLNSQNQILVNGLFDGHNGSKVSKLAKETFVKYLISSFKPQQISQNDDQQTNAENKLDNNKSQSEKDQQNNDQQSETQTCNNIVKSFLSFDLSTKDVVGGAAALVTLFTNDTIYVANAGDSRCLCITNDLKHYQQLSTDFKPAIDTERKRLEKLGCKVEQSTFNQNGFQIQLGPQRVFPGGLSVSRSFGDWKLKDEQIVKNLITQLKHGNMSYISSNKVIMYRSDDQDICLTRPQEANNVASDSEDNNNSNIQQQHMQNQIISAMPEIQYIQTNQKYHILVMGCDGVFDVLSNSDICKIIERNYLQFRIKSLMQVLMRNIDKQQFDNQEEIKIEEDDKQQQQNKVNWFKRTGQRVSSSIELVQKVLQKAKVKYFVNYEDEQLSEELLLQSDYLCSQMLSKKIVQMALQRESTDNVSVCLSMFRYQNSPKSIYEYRKLYETETKKKTHNKSFFKRENSVSEINSEDLYSQNSDNNVTIFVSNDDPSKEFY